MPLPRIRAGAAAGTMVALGPFMVLCAVALHDPEYATREGAAVTWWLVASIACGAAAVAGGLLLRRARRPGRILSALAVLGFVGVAVPALAHRPALALAILLPAFAAILRFAGPLRALDDSAPAADTDPAGRRGAAAASSAMALFAWLLVAVVQAARGSLAVGLAVGAFAAAALYGTVWLATDARPGRLRRLVPLAILTASVGLALLARRSPSLALTCLVPLPIAILVVARGAVRRASTGLAAVASLWDAVSDHPARLLIFTFAVLIAAGAVALSLPLCAAGGAAVPFIDATFTAVSATCVTGLTVVDTATAFSRAGQVVILLLVQLGGLGIMTFYTAALALLGRRLALKQEVAVASMLGDDSRDFRSSLRQVFLVTFAFELLGAAVLTGVFHFDGAPLGAAAFRGVFTAISAFCNAGFTLATDSLVAYRGSPLVLHAVAALIIAGGLGPAVIVAVPSIARRRRVPLQTKVVVATTASLLALGTVLYAALEWGGSLAGLPFFDRLHNAWFQSAANRTAGFNSVDMTAMGPATVTTAIVMMFIGGSPGSTAGGMKTTTTALLIAAVRAALRGRPEVMLFKRTVPHLAVHKAAAIGALYSGAAIVAIVALQLTQRMEPMTAVFEAVSALGTVGLSIGGTAQLDGIGKIIIMTCMFLGRLGPLTLFMLLSDRQVQGRIGLPEENVATG